MLSSILAMHYQAIETFCLVLLCNPWSLYQECWLSSPPPAQWLLISNPVIALSCKFFLVNSQSKI